MTIADSTVTLSQRTARAVQATSAVMGAPTFLAEPGRRPTGDSRVSTDGMFDTYSLSIDQVEDTNWRVVDGDLNGNGNPDLVWQHQTAGWVAVRYLAGSQVLSTQFQHQSCRGHRLEDPRRRRRRWRWQGRFDLATRDPGLAAAWLMDGTQVTNTVLLSIDCVQDNNSHIVGAGDTDGDGKADFVWQHQSSGWLAVWSMDGVDVLSTRFLSVDWISDFNWHIRGVGDVDGDSHADIIWQTT